MDDANFCADARLAVVGRHQRLERLLAEFADGGDGVVVVFDRDVALEGDGVGVARGRDRHLVRTHGQFQVVAYRAERHVLEDGVPVDQDVDVRRVGRDVRAGARSNLVVAGSRSPIQAPS